MKAINFNKTGSLTYGSPLVAFGNNFTIDVWLKLNSLTQKDYSTLFMRGTSTTANGVHIFGNKLAIRRASSGGIGNELEPISNLEINKWHRLTFTYSSQSLKYYRDGNLIKTVTLTGGFTTTTSISFGDWSGGYGTQLDGAIHDFKFFNRELNYTELTKLFENKSYDTPFNDSLILQLKFNDVNNLTGVTYYGSFTEDIFKEYPINKTFILHNNEYKKWNTQKSGDAIEKMSSNISENGIASASSELVSSYQAYAWKAFNKTADLHVSGIIDAWHTVLGLPNNCWLKYEFKVPKKIIKYTLSTFNHSTGSTRIPKHWVFQGSNDDSIWIDLHTVNNSTGWVQVETRSFTPNITGYYKYYRIYIYSNNGDVNYTSIGELGMFEESQPSTWSTISTTLPTKEQFLLHGMDYLAPLLNRVNGASPLDSLNGDIDVITWTDDSEKKMLLVDSKKTNPNGVIYPTGDIQLFGIKELKSVNVTATGNGRIGISVDSGVTWNKLSGNTWDVITDIADGMTFTEFNALTGEQLEALKGDGNTIRFAYYLSNDTEIDRIELHISMAGTPEFANKNDYDMSYDATTQTITYDIKKSGHYIVNYMNT